MKIREITENRLHYKKLESETELIEHAKVFSGNLKLDGIPLSAMNRYPVVCSTMLAHLSKSLSEARHISTGNQVINKMKELNQFDSLNLHIGSKVSIINAQLQGDNIELWGFTDPKIITKIYRDPSEHSIIQFEFNNDENDVWPRTENAEYNGKYLMYSAFFDNSRAAKGCIIEVMLIASSDLSVRNHIVEDSYQPPELEVGDKILKGKFKNSPAEIKGFTKDKHNQPVLKTNKGDVQLFKPRVTKLMKESYTGTTFEIQRRKLNVPALIKAGAILVTYPHGEQGWETDNREDWAFSLLSLYNVLQGGWPSEAKKYLKPQSYKRAEQQINSSAPNLGTDKLVYDGKYNQILWSIKRLGIPDSVAFVR